MGRVCQFEARPVPETACSNPAISPRGGWYPVGSCGHIRPEFPEVES
jgi:hypothetical protein